MTTSTTFTKTLNGRYKTWKRSKKMNSTRISMILLKKSLLLVRLSYVIYLTNCFKVAIY